jgi:hypothetical protein
MQIQGLPTEFGPRGDHHNENGVAGGNPPETPMEANIASFDHEHKRCGSKQPEGGGDGMDMDDSWDGRPLMEVVLQIEAKANPHENPEEG